VKICRSKHIIYKYVIISYLAAPVKKAKAKTRRGARGQNKFRGTVYFSIIAISETN
jgi:hypothetical protein